MGVTPDELNNTGFSPLQLKILRELRKKNNQMRTLFARSLCITGKLVWEEIGDLLESDDVKSYGKWVALRYELVRDPLSTTCVD